MYYEATDPNDQIHKICDIYDNLSKRSMLSEIESLAILTSVRQILSLASKETNIYQILTFDFLTTTDILKIVSDVFQPLSNQLQEHSRFIKLECIWILINLCFGDEQDINFIFEFRQGTSLLKPFL